MNRNRYSDTARKAREAAARETKREENAPLYRGRKIRYTLAETYDEVTGQVDIELYDGETIRVQLREVGVDTRIADITEAEEEAYVEKDVRYIERLFQVAADNGIGETLALQKAHQKLGTPRYMKAFAAWEEKYL